MQLQMMSTLPQFLPEDGAFLQEWALDSITIFSKCTRWQVEETQDPINCPYHYFCDSTYPGNYPPIVDLQVLFFTVASFLSAVTFTLLEIKRRTAGVKFRNSRRYLLPSGPVALPIILLILAKGHRINTIFPLSYMGPALLQLVHVSALAFKNQVDENLKYTVLEASTVSGILHAGLYLDSIILPYYTGMEALMSSTFSGECASCVCRKDALVVGGGLVSYRGWSKTTFSVASTLCSRMLCRLFGEEKLSLLINLMLEGMSWILVANDSFNLMKSIPHGGFPARAVYGSLCILIFLNVLKKVCSLLAWPTAFHPKQKQIYLSQNNV